MLLVFSLLAGCLPFCRGRKHNWMGEAGFGMASSLAFLTGAGYVLYLCGGGVPGGKFLIYIPFLWALADLWVRRGFWKERLFSLRELSLEKAGGGLLLFCFFCALFLLACEKTLPCGWDPAFHAILAEKILRTGELSRNWLPFENIPLNYPQGIHLLTAVYAGASGIAVPAALKILMFSFTLAETLLLGGLGERAFPGKRIGFYTATAWLALNGMATPINFWAWGGYPTAACFLYFSALLFGVWHYKRKDICLVSLLFLWGALALTHLLALLLVLLAMGFWSLLLLFQWKKERANWKSRPEYRIWRELFFSGLLALFSFMPCLTFQYIISGGMSGKSDAFYFTEEPLFTLRKILEEGGLIFSAGILGVVFYLFENRKRRMRSLPKYLLTAALGILAVFLFLGVPFRKWIALPLTGEEFSILVPSRFMSFSCLLLTVFAGSFLGRLFSFQKAYPCQKYVNKVLLLLLAGWALASFYFGNTGNFSTEEARARAGELKKLLPENAYVVVDPSRIPYAHWLPCMLWKPCVTNPIPASEDRSPVRKGIALFLETPGEKMDPRLIRKFEESRKKKVIYAVIPPEGENVPVRIFPALGKR